MQENKQNEPIRKTRLSALPERHAAPSEDFMRALAAWQRLKTNPPASPNSHQNSGIAPPVRA